MSADCVGPFPLNQVTGGDCQTLIAELPDKCLDIVVTSPPYWGQRLSNGHGIEEDPRDYLDALTVLFTSLLPKLKDGGIVWINIGDAYNTPVNWRLEDREYSTLGADQNGLPGSNSAYTKPRHQRKSFIDDETPWLTYGNLLALPYRLVLGLCDAGFIFRGEVIWRKKNPMPEGRARRPHRQHEPIFLLAKREDHTFRTVPPVPSVWEFANDKVPGIPHFSRYPLELPRRCIDAYGMSGPEVLVFDPFTGSGSTGLAALELGCSFLGFEIERVHVAAANERLAQVAGARQPRLIDDGLHVPGLRD